MTTPLPPLGKVMNWIEASGFTVSYLYEDLVFIESNAFLVRFEQVMPFRILIHFNTESLAEKAQEIENVLLTEAKNHGIKPATGKKFSLVQKNNEEIDVRFEN